jgi:hypothetical protein
MMLLMTVKKGFSMRMISLNALLALALVAVGGVARADIQTGGTASEIYDSTADSLAATAVTAGDAAAKTSSTTTTTNADGSVTVTITTTDADGTVHTQTKTTYPATTTTNSGSSGSSGGSGNNLGQMLQGAAMQGLMGALGGNGGGMNVPGLPGGLGNLGASLGGGVGGASGAGVGAGGGAGTQAPHVMTEEEKKAAEAKELADKKAKAACRDANTIPVAKGNPGKAKDDIVAGPDVGKDVAKPEQGPGMVASNCVRPKYDQAHPMGTLTKEQMEALAAKGQYVNMDGNQSAANNGQACAMLTQSMSKVGLTNTWKPGMQVKGNDIPLGTPVATFNYDGNYSSAGTRGVSGSSHTGLYYGQDSGGVYLFNQYIGSGGAKISYFPFNSGNEGGDKYYVIKSPTAFLQLLYPQQAWWMAYTQEPSPLEKTVLDCMGLCHA